MSKQRTPALADWLVTFLDPRTSGLPLTVRAAALEVRGGTALLLGAGGSPVFSVPAGAVHIRRLEDGEKAAADLVSQSAEPALASPPAKAPARRTRG